MTEDEALRGLAVALYGAGCALKKLQDAEAERYAKKIARRKERNSDGPIQERFDDDIDW